MNETLVSFETYAKLGPTFVARLMGIAYVTYAHYRSGKRELPLYHERHIAVLRMLSKVDLQRLIEKHGNSTQSTR